MDGNVARRVHQRLMGKSESKILKQRAQLEDLGVDGRMKLVIEVCFCEQADEIPCCVKCAGCLD